METLHQKRVLITGAARGLGQALALRVAAEGARLILVDCELEGLCITAGLVSEAAAEVTTFECDLTDPLQISQTVARIREQFQGIDVLINNAGVAWYGTVANMSAEDWERVLAVNLLAPIQLIREFLPDLQAQPESHVLNVSSVYGLMATNRATAYHCTKFALVGLSEALRAECDRNGLGVTAFCPGFMQTDLFGPAEDGKPDRRPPAWLCSSTDRVADKAVKAILRDRRMVVVSPLAHVLYATRRVFPGLFDSLYRIGRRRKLRERKERVRDQSCVEIPRPPDGEQRAA